MRTKKPNRIVQCSLLCIGAMGGTVAWEIFRAKPNVCLIVVDSLRADAISKSVGSAQTPHFHQLIDEGVEFRRAFAHAPSTLPSQTAMFSGLLPHESRVANNGASIGDDVELLAEHLESSGYETRGFVGLQDLWKPIAGDGVERGFGEWAQSEQVVSRCVDTEAVVMPWLDELSGDEPFFLFAHFADPHAPYDANGFTKRHAEATLDGVPVGEKFPTSEQTFFEHELRISPGLHMFEFRSNHPFHMRDFQWDGPDGVKVTVRQSDLEVADHDVSIAIQNDGDEVVSVNVDAWIHDAPSNTEARIRYRREVEAVDVVVGRMVAELKARGIYDDTLIVITGNHGEALGEHGATGHDVNLYDELLHVPLLLKLPAKTKHLDALKAVRDRIARHIDLVPTVFELLGLPAPDTSGESLLDEDPRVLFAETHQPEAPRELFCMRDERYKLIYDASGNSFEMYDLSQDPSELDDVFRTQGHLVQPWQAKLKGVAQANVAP